MSETSRDAMGRAAAGLAALLAAGLAACAGTVTDDAGPALRFRAPADGARLANPVRFELEADQLDQVELVADGEHPLGEAWDPSERSDHLYRFAGTGVERSITAIGRRAGVEVARAELRLTVEPDDCPTRFFVEAFDPENQDPARALAEQDLTRGRETALAALVDRVDGLRACGAGVSLGGMASLLLFEGALRLAAFNTRCDENSYVDMAEGCDAVPEALYSYQFGIGAIHTSNFHPCKGGDYTAGMRGALAEAIAAAGFPAGPELVSADDAARFAEVCPDATPTAVDHYLLEAHAFGVPRDDAGNALASYGRFPLFDPALSIAMTFRELEAHCAELADDRAAIASFGGGDPRYAEADFQDLILEAYVAFEQASCR